MYDGDDNRKNVPSCICISLYGYFHKLTADRRLPAEGSGSFKLS